MVRRTRKDGLSTTSTVRAGTHPTELTVTDSAGNTDTTSVDVVVRNTVSPPSGGGGGGGSSDADIQVNVSRPTGSVSAGTPFDYTVRVHNGGILDAVDTNMSADLTGTGSPTITGAPDFGGFTSCAFTPTSVDCRPTTISGGSTLTVVITVVASTGSNGCVASASSSSPDDNPGNNSDSAAVLVTQRAPDDFRVSIDTAFTSRLEVPPPNGSVRGQVLLNGTQLDQTDNSAPFRHHLKGRKGKNIVEARVVSGTGEGRWVFNFSGAPNFVPGSLAAESGQVISRGSDRVVFRVGPSAEPIRFRYRLSR